jgi:transposase-like protein
MRANVPIYVADRMKALKHENRELRQVSEMPRKASMYFAMAEFDRPLKR